MTSGDRILYESGRDTVDEIVCRGVDIHVEVMSDNNIWMSVTRGDQRLMVNFGKRTRCAPLTYFVEEDSDTPWTWEREQEHPGPDDPPVIKDI